MKRDMLQIEYVWAMNCKINNVEEVSGAKTALRNHVNKNRPNKSNENMQIKSREESA